MSIMKFIRPDRWFMRNKLEHVLSIYASEVHKYAPDSTALIGRVLIDKNGRIYIDISGEELLGEREYVRCFTNGKFTTNGSITSLSDATYLVVSVGGMEVCDRRIIYYYDSITNNALKECIRILKNEIRYADKIF